MSVYEIQQERKRNEREPIDWDAYRAALIESGMVRESWQRRHVANFGFECDIPEDLDETCEHYLAGAGMANSATGAVFYCRSLPEALGFV